MATLVSFEGDAPKIEEGVFLAPTAALVGKVTMQSGASAWFGCVMRGDFDRIEIGAGSSVQDNAVLHAAPGLPTLIGDNVIVGHGALLEGCVIEEGAVLGMGCVVLQRAHVGAGAMVAAGAVVKEGQEIPAGHLAVGAPARVVKELSGSSAQWVDEAAPAYHGLVGRYETHELIDAGAH